MKTPAWTPWDPPKYEIADAAAIQAVAQGRASPDQQMRAMRYIVENMAGTYDLSFSPSSDRETSFAEGKRFVGLQLVKFIKLNLSLLKQKETK